jgi:hypothetical protein
MKKITLFLFFASFIFAESELRYEMNLNLGNSNEPNYTIVKDDCLWDLAMKFYGNPFMWRHIWEHNQYIIDPHWIFPGNPLLIPGIPSTAASTSAISVPSSENILLYDTSKNLVQLSEQVRNAITLTREQFALLDKYRFFISLEAQRQIPFIYEREHRRRNKKDRNAPQVSLLRSYGEVVVNDGRPLLVQNKNATVRIDLERSEREQLIRVGTELGFYLIREDLRNRKGVVIEPVALGTVRSIDGEYATINVDKLWGRLSEGAIVAPLREYKTIGVRLTYKTLRDSTEIRTIARLNPQVSVKPYETFFIDKGLQDGMVIGDHIVFYEQARDITEKQHSQKPIMEALVVKTEKNTSTIRVTVVRNLTTSDLFFGVRQGRVVPRD